MRLNTEQRCTTRDERVAGSHRDIACLKVLHNIVLFAREGKFELRGIEVEGRLRVIIEVERHLRADGRLHVELYLFVEVEGPLVACTFGKCRIIDDVMLHAHRERCRALCLDANAARAKQFFGRTERELHVEQVKLSLSFLFLHCLMVLIEEVGTALLAFGVLAVLLHRHRYRIANQLFAEHRLNQVAVVLPIVLHHRLHVFRSLEVSWMSLLQIGSHVGRSGRNGITAVIYRIRLFIIRWRLLSDILALRQAGDTHPCGSIAIGQASEQYRTSHTQTERAQLMITLC